MIKEKRNAMNYTQEEMANALNISLRQYVRIDNEKCLPRKDILKDLIRILKLSDSEIGVYIKRIIKNG